MAVQQSTDRNAQSFPYLSPKQQDLLVAALNSQTQSNNKSARPALGDNGLTKRNSSDTSESHTMNGAAMFQSPAIVDGFNDEFTPDLDYLDGDNSFDFDNADLGGEMIGALPGGNAEQHEKRKNPDDSGDSEEGDSKRQETQEGEKGAKKPGRKPLTNEPTTKRKAQNRAAQRAFRERKEKHLKDLETKVAELTKSQEADQHEKGLLKAQVDRLQAELREQRKHLSLNAGAAGRSPSLAAQGDQNRGSNSSISQNNFQFDFPKFGNNQVFGSPIDFTNLNNHQTSVTPPATTHSSGSGSFGGLNQQSQPARNNSAGRSASPRSLGTGSALPSPSSIPNLNQPFTGNFAPYSTNENMHGFASTLPQMSGNNSDPFGDLFSPSIMKNLSQTGTLDGNYFTKEQSTSNNTNTATTSNGGDSTAGIPDNRVFRFNSNSNASDSASPSASSLSQWNANGTANSSCGTSPEPSHGSPANKDKAAESFCDKIKPDCAQNSQLSQPTSSYNDLSFNTSNNAAYSVPQLDTFDPVLFGDYRESQDNFGGADFSNGFFDDALNTAPFDYGSPSNLFGILQNLPQPQTTTSNAAPPSRNLMAEIEKTRNGGDDDYGLPTMTQPAKKTEGSGKLISCNNIWSQLQANPDYQEGKFDLDGLCSELKAKARCSESGIVVEQEYVDAALRKLTKKDPESMPMEDMPTLMFEQESWDAVLKRLGGGIN